MTKHCILLVEENIHSARYLKQLLEEAGYVVDWAAAVTPDLLSAGLVPDTVVFDLPFLDREDEDSLRSLREHPRWEGVPTLVIAAGLDREARRLLLRLGADEVMSRPVDGSELLLRLSALLNTSGNPCLVPSSSQGVTGPQRQKRASLHQLAQFASTAASAHNAEAILVQSLRSLRREVSFDVGFVCAETEPTRYKIVAQMEAQTRVMSRWYEPGMTYTGWLATHKKPLLVPNVDKEMRVRMMGRERGTNRSLQSFIGVPLIHDGHVVGTMELASYRRGALGTQSMAALQVAAVVGLATLRNAKARCELAQANPLSADGEQRAAVQSKSGAMHNLMEVASRVRDSSVPVLITGETGTGKEVMARYLHGAAARNNRPFVAVACAAVPETFQLREMFGIEKGVLSGVDGKAGRFEECAGGTLFLDDVGRMPISLQAKLLRVLEERRFSRIGSGRVQEFTGRVVAASSTDLKSAIESGAFLAELYHRLALVEFSMPPLRSRPEDIGLFVEHFTHQFCQEHGLPEPRLDTATEEHMLRYLWPGNVRELKNVVERTLLLSGGANLFWKSQADTEPADIPLKRMLSIAMEHQFSVPELQLHYSQYVYDRVGHNKAEACRILRINYRTLRNHLLAAESGGI